jgi:hypothetical protein
MTIAVVIKVNDGLVLAADSATTLMSRDNDGNRGIANIYNNANKVFNLHKGLPIGGLTWGRGNIGPTTIASLSKDLRRRLAGEDPSHHDWKIDPENYHLSDVAARVKEFFHDERFAAQFSGGDHKDDHDELGLMVGGYSSDAMLPEGYLITMSPADGCNGPEMILPQDLTGASWWGQPEAITRIVNGISGYLPQALINLGVPDKDVENYTQAIVAQVAAGLVPEAMPIQDAIELADFLVDATIKFVRFSPGHATVGGPIEVAAITRHEGYKWIKRKHYYRQELNPEGGGAR